VGVESADIPQRRGRISSVVRRGLKNRQGGVISTAAVNVYD